LLVPKHYYPTIPTALVVELDVEMGVVEAADAWMDSISEEDILVESKTGGRRLT
jgi:hypothetical protein